MNTEANEAGGCAPPVLTAQMPTSAVEALRAAVRRAIERARVFDDGSDGADAESAQSVVAILSAALAASQEAPRADSPEDRFEQYVLDGIARSPEPLRELGKYLTRVLDEDQWPAAERLLLQLATANPTPPASQGDAAPAGDAVAWAEPIIEALRRCDICWGDDAGVDIGRDKLDALTTFGLLEKVGRGKWKITDAGFAAYALGSLAAAPAPAAPAGDAVRELVVKAIEDVGRGADVYIASKIVAKKIIEAIAAAPAPAVEREACQECKGYEAQGVFCAACGTDWSEQGRVCKTCKNTPRTDSDFCTPCEDAGMTEVSPPAEAREPAADGNGGAT